MGIGGRSLAQPPLGSRDLGTITEGDSDGYTMDVSTDGGRSVMTKETLDRNRVCERFAFEDLKEVARGRHGRSAENKTSASSSGRDIPNARTLEGYVDVETMCDKDAKDKQKLDKKATQKEGRNKEGATKNNSNSSEAAKEQREKNAFILLRSPKKGKLPPGSAFNLIPPKGEEF